MHLGDPTGCLYVKADHFTNTTMSTLTLYDNVGPVSLWREVHLSIIVVIKNNLQDILLVLPCLMTVSNNGDYGKMIRVKIIEFQ